MPSIARFAKESPFVFALGFSAVKTIAADLLVQKTIEKKGWDEIDWRRNATFAAFGFCYLGGVQYTIYVPIFGRMFPKAAEYAAKPLREKAKDFVGTRNMLMQTFLDMCVYHPFIYFPSFYMLKSYMSGGTLEEGREMYAQNYKDDLPALWKVWVPPTILNFTFSPMHMRLPVAAATSMVWTCILSATRGGSNDVVVGENADPWAAIGNQGALIKEAMEPVKLDPSLDHAIVMVSGPDRPGLIPMVSEAIHARCHGTISESKMVKLGGQFMMMLVVSVKPESKKLLDQHLLHKGSDVAQVLSVSITDISDQNRLTAKELIMKRRSTAERKECRKFFFRVEGPAAGGHGGTSKGIVNAVTKHMAKHGAAVDRFETSKKVRTVKGEKVEWFIMTGEAETSRGTVREDFEYDLQEVGHKLGISFEFDFEALEK